MKGMLYKPEVLTAKLKVLEQYGEAQTRRVIKPQPNIPDDYDGFDHFDVIGQGVFADGTVAKPRYQVGEVVYIKEAWKIGEYSYKKFAQILYKSGGEKTLFSWNDWLEKNTRYGGSTCGDDKWRSPMFLKAIHARYFLKIKDIRAERLQEITEEDAINEGAVVMHSEDTNEAGYSFRLGFIDLWDSINPDYHWDSNPWVFVYVIERWEKKG